MHANAQPIRYIHFVVATGSTLDTRIVAMAVIGDELQENPFDIGLVIEGQRRRKSTFKHCT